MWAWRTFFALLILVLSPGLLLAQSQEGVLLSPEDLEALTEQARQKGVQIIVLSPEGNAVAEAPPSTVGSAGDMIAQVRSELRSLLQESPTAFGRIAEGLAAASPGGELRHHLVVILVVVGIMIAAGFGERLYGSWLKGKMRSIWPVALENMPEKMCFLLTRFVGRLIGFALFGAATIAVAAAVFEANPATEATVLYLVFGVVGVRSMVEFWRVWISPGLSEFRLPALSDPEAEPLFRCLAAAAWASGLMLCTGLWLEALVADRRAVIVAQLLLLILILLVNLFALVAIRKTVAGLISGAAGHSGQPVNKLRGFLGANWHVIMGLYFVAAWLTSSAGIIRQDIDALGPSFGMLLVLVSTLTLYSMAVVLLDWIFYRRAGAPHRRLAEAGVALPVIEHEGPEASDHRSTGWFTGIRSYEDLAKQSLSLFMFIFIVGGLMFVWGVDIADEDSPFVRLWDVIFILFAGYIALQSARIWIERKIEAEGGFDEPEPGEEGAAGGVSRLATLLPLFRNFILATIVVLVVMIGLSELGIDIAPLFAGAGVIGLAIGFGAQTLIRDIFSGAFFLVDDAFRRGEYIDIGDVKGTVERISVRSMQVRHHNGPLHTVPFGEIRYLTNFSRDWVMMKLKLRVTYDTDVTKVRKLIKKLGQELLEDPENGHKFIQPLKSQGVLAMEDSAMIIRVKFMTKPGDQFVLRKMVYAAIQELFASEGIKFAHREVTVRIAEGEQESHPPSDAERKKAIAGAVAPALEDQEDAPAGDDR